MTPFDIPDDFRAFMQQVVAYLEEPGEDKLLDGEDTLRSEVGYGGRIDGSTKYRFWYLTADGHSKWEVVLEELAVRAIADGLLIEVMGEPHEVVRTKQRERSGKPLLIWGEYGDDALRTRNREELVTALDSLHASATARPRMLRVWSAADDQVVAVVWKDRCALYVVESLDGYATSSGDRNLTDSFEVADHNGQPLIVPFADCISWDLARNGLLQFVDHGNLGPEIRIEGRIPSMLLMMGDVDRKAAIAARAEPPRLLARSSLPRMMTPIPVEVDEGSELTEPVEVDLPLTTERLSAWAMRLLQLLSSRELVELGTGSLDEIAYQLGGLLQAHGIEAEHSLETAEWLANEIGAVRGIARLFATAGDLQVALRRSRDA